MDVSSAIEKTVQKTLEKAETLVQPGALLLVVEFGELSFESSIELIWKRVPVSPYVLESLAYQLR